MTNNRSQQESIAPQFRPLAVVIVTLGVLLAIFSASRWYAAEVSIPRYCAQPELALQRLAAVITEKRPAGDGSRRDYIVAAKLEFLLPARADEPAADYLRRLRNHLELQCG
jgi:hypothetical protein